MENGSKKDKNISSKNYFIFNKEKINNLKNKNKINYKILIFQIF